MSGAGRLRQVASRKRQDTNPPDGAVTSRLTIDGVVA